MTLEGKLSGPWVDELERCWSDLRTKNPAPVSVKLEELSFCDARGTDLLLRMEREGVPLVHCPHFIRQLLGSSTETRKRVSKENVEEN